MKYGRAGFYTPAHGLPEIASCCIVLPVCTTPMQFLALKGLGYLLFSKMESPNLLMRIFFAVQKWHNASEVPHVDCSCHVGGNQDAKDLSLANILFGTSTLICLFAVVKVNFNINGGRMKSHARPEILSCMVLPVFTTIHT